MGISEMNILHGGAAMSKAILQARIKKLEEQARLREIDCSNQAVEIDQLRKALKFYADEQNYIIHTAGTDDTEIAWKSIDNDKGKIATEALAGKKEKRKNSKRDNTDWGSK